MRARGWFDGWQGCIIPAPRIFSCNRLDGVVNWRQRGRIGPKFAQYVLCEPNVLPYVFKLGGWQGFWLQMVISWPGVRRWRTVWPGRGGMMEWSGRSPGVHPTPGGAGKTGGACLGGIGYILQPFKTTSSKHGVEEKQGGHDFWAGLQKIRNSPTKHW